MGMCSDLHPNMFTGEKHILFWAPSRRGNKERAEGSSHHDSQADQGKQTTDIGLFGASRSQPS